MHTHIFSACDDAATKNIQNALITTSNIQLAGLEFTVAYDIEPHELVEIFVAYCVSHLNGAEPTLPILDEFERKELQKLSKTARKTPAPNRPQRAHNDIDDLLPGDSDDDADDDVMSAYGICKTPKVSVATSDILSACRQWFDQLGQSQDEHGRSNKTPRNTGMHPLTAMRWGEKSSSMCTSLSILPVSAEIVCSGSVVM